ncbi:MAG: hypothetical protein A2Y41_01585 [Spirochaetes bacterium GWB1_36_13]|nr:MAG: hypothetical protein A2Y41_01585 [Spirochaetes bacterium GWB1_36_13]
MEQIFNFTEHFPLPVFFLENETIIYSNQHFSFLIHEMEIFYQNSFPDLNDFLCEKNKNQLFNAIKDLKNKQLKKTEVFLEIKIPKSRQDFSFLISLSCFFLSGKEYIICTVQETVNEKKELLKMAEELFENSIEGIVITDAKGTILKVNPSFTSITGYHENEAVGKNPKILKSGRHPDEFYQFMWKSLTQKGEWKGEIWNKRKNGEQYLEFLTIKSLKNEEGKTLKYIAMLNDITHLRAFEKNMQRELFLAEQIQKNLLPSKEPIVKGAEISFFYKPMEDVGGDFFDFFETGDEIGIFISDVSGHGVPAAFITSMVKVLLTTAGDKIKNPVDICAYLNKELLNKVNENFLTVFYGVYHTLTRKMRYTKCAHPSPVIIRDKELIFLDHKASFMLGVFEKISFHEFEIQLKPNDKIIFYTDGLTEALNPDKEEFEDIFYRTIRKNSHLSIKKLIELIHYQLLLHCEKDIFEDDICIVGMDIKK